MANDLPISVWPVAQRPPALQRRGRYVPETFAHPGKMAPAIAARAIETYTDPGEVVLDPMCGIGTTVVEAMHLGRRGIGIEYEERWAEVAADNVDLAKHQGAKGHGRIVTADARQASKVLGKRYEGRIALVVTSPPYGASLHGQVRAVPGKGVRKSDDAYSADPANLAHVPIDDLLGGFAEILCQCEVLLKPGGYVAVTVRPYREAGALVDLPSMVFACGQDAGLVSFERNVALLAGLKGDGLVSRVSFFQIERVRKARAAGIPLMCIAHEDLLILRKPLKIDSSRTRRTR